VSSIVTGAIRVLINRCVESLHQRTRKRGTPIGSRAGRARSRVRSISERKAKIPTDSRPGVRFNPGEQKSEESAASLRRMVAPPSLPPLQVLPPGKHMRSGYLPELLGLSDDHKAHEVVDVDSVRPPRPRVVDVRKPLGLEGHRREPLELHRGQGMSSRSSRQPTGLSTLTPGGNNPPADRSKGTARHDPRGGGGRVVSRPRSPPPGLLRPLDSGPAGKEGLG
jgi:hypothetical protein